MAAFMLVAVLLLGYGLEIPAPVLLVAGAVGGLVLLVTRGWRRRRRAAQERRRLEQAALNRARREAERAHRRAERRAAVRDRTGVDLDLVDEAVREVRERGSKLVRRTGKRVNGRLAARYRKDAPEPDAAQRLLDLDQDFGALRSQRRTEEILRLNDQLGARVQDASASADRSFAATPSRSPGRRTSS